MGKKSRKSTTNSATSRIASKNPPILNSAVKALSHFIKLSDKEKLPMENIFSTHIHSVSSCDGDGAYNIISLFVLNPSIVPTGSPEMSVITVCTVRCHDNIRQTVLVPTDTLRSDDGASLRELSFGTDELGAGRTSAEYYHACVEQKQKEIGTGFRKVPYQCCSKLVSDCLRRMKEQKKILVGNEERTVVRLYSLESTDLLHLRQITLPAPNSAPDINTLWLTLNRPEYYFFSFNEDLYNFFKCEPHDLVITSGYLKESLSFLLKDEYRRLRLLAMLEHMAVWHMVGNEDEVASWLLWERESMMIQTIDNPQTVDIMQNNIITQLMVNKFFDGETGSMMMLKFPQEDNYGNGIANYFFYNQHMTMTGRLPPAFIVTATIAKGIGIKSGDSTDDERMVDISRTIKSLKIKRASCAICGVTRFSSGGHLATCSTCDSVAYCSREHQILHWKKGGHKQQCRKK